MRCYAWCPLSSVHITPEYLSVQFLQHAWGGLWVVACSSHEPQANAVCLILRPPACSHLLRPQSQVQHACVCR